MQIFGVINIILYLLNVFKPHADLYHRKYKPEPCITFMFLIYFIIQEVTVKT